MFLPSLGKRRETLPYIPIVDSLKFQDAYEGPKTNAFYLRELLCLCENRMTGL